MGDFISAGDFGFGSAWRGCCIEMDFSSTDVFLPSRHNLQILHSFPHWKSFIQNIMYSSDQSFDPQARYQRARRPAPRPPSRDPPQRAQSPKPRPLSPDLPQRSRPPAPRPPSPDPPLSNDGPAPTPLDRITELFTYIFDIIYIVFLVCAAISEFFCLGELVRVYLEIALCCFDWIMVIVDPQFLSWKILFLYRICHGREIKEHFTSISQHTKNTGLEEGCRKPQGIRHDQQDVQIVLIITWEPQIGTCQSPKKELAFIRKMDAEFTSTGRLRYSTFRR